jgi:hypothetical protein
MLNKRLAIPSLAAASLVFAACGGGDVTLQVLTQGTDELQPVADLPVEFLPFDRDSLFAALSAAASEPEPQVPAQLRQEFDSVLVLQETWRVAEANWNEVRDSLRQLSERMQRMDRRSREYRPLFERFNGMEGREARLNRDRASAFEAFTNLQATNQQRLDSVRAVIEAWEDMAFQDYADIEATLLEDLAREIAYDTTDATGSLTRRLSGGTWWVHARVAIPAGELYWNVPTDASTDTLRLTPDNAVRRLVF